ncbi:uncharacterized protein A1O9_07397 [Exophiala aquamarina CBS 119918]|uniref:Impact N-terminal domain-containing protein n=1 Tax=Exophiala aquamarina CBS 119918 TaxID=1182545 RepID=A0A072PBR6_9EURO|nr:uncharacterized protein A1O9_07397 [Exophiala aquamarina CBS 119918]KEF57207.1 hypothetical protein A1O9_07397 [Exophiala aquamarina CBS 119918]
MSTACNKRGLSDGDGGGDGGNQQNVFKSSPITDRASTFIAHFHPHDANPAARPNSLHTKGKPTSLTQTIKSFQNHPAFATADHRIAAWRRASTQRTLVPAPLNNTNPADPGANVTYTTNSDDDGERYAGKRLERVLNELNVQGTVVVARWYGGVLLGPVRFTHIENVAREAVAKWRRHVGGGVGDDGRGKRLKTDDGATAGAAAPAPAPASISPSDSKPQQLSVAEEGQRLRLVEQLGNRDSSIVVLRALLAEKRKAMQETHKVTASPTALVPSPPTSSEPTRLVSNADAADPGGESSRTLVPPTLSAGGDGDGDGDGDAAAKSTPAATPVPAPAVSSSSPTGARATKPQAMDYSHMPMPRLRQLEKARDATIAFILKQIDKAEAEEREMELEMEKERAA